MGRWVRVAAALLLAVAACLAALPATTTGNKITINWKPNVNYSNWTDQHRPFYKGDWLGTHSLLCLPFASTSSIPRSEFAWRNAAEFARIPNPQCSTTRRGRRTWCR
jgi:hypothetical protein